MSSGNNSTITSIPSPPGPAQTGDNMSSTTSTSTFAPSQTQPGLSNNNNNNGGVSSSLYLFTFLITIVVLGVISAALLFRAYIIRRRFQQRVEEAILNGRPLPPDAAAALGLIRPNDPRRKKEKVVGKMPQMCEAELFIDRSGSGGWDNTKAGWDMEKGDVHHIEEVDVDKTWRDFTPLSVLHFPAPNPETPLPEFVIPPLSSRQRLLPSWAQTRPLPQLRPELNRGETTQTIEKVQPDYEIPFPGEEVVVGVVIALPFEEKVDEIWTRQKIGSSDDHGGNGGYEDEEKEVPQVCLGVVSVKVQ